MGRRHELGWAGELEGCARSRVNIIALVIVIGFKDYCSDRLWSTGMSESQMMMTRLMLKRVGRAVLFILYYHSYQDLRLLSDEDELL